MHLLVNRSIRLEPVLFSQVRQFNWPSKSMYSMDFEKWKVSYCNRHEPIFCFTKLPALLSVSQTTCLASLRISAIQEIRQMRSKNLNTLKYIKCLFSGLEFTKCLLA